MRDPYQVLGVPKNANAGAVKSAFRKLAKKLHPDANINDKTASGKFAELNSAYEILGDEAKRKAFDRGEIDAEGKPKFHGFPGGGPGGRPGGAAPGGGFENFTWSSEGLQRGARRGGSFGGIDDILKDVFGGAAQQSARRRSPFEPQEFREEPPPQGRDVTGTVAITLEEAATGTMRRVHLPTGREIEVKVPPGLADGQTIRLKGQGLPGPAGAIGDALIGVTIAAHALFTRDGADLRLDLPITLYEAVLGGRVRVPTLDSAVELTLPPGASSGRVFRLKGKGMPRKDGIGDLYATVRIALPDSADPELEELMRRWRDANPYDPRREIS